MDPLSKLPLECLQHTLKSLDRAGYLVPLLRTNKYIASVALLYLYDRPNPHNASYAKQLIYTLVGRHLSANHSQLLRLALGTDTTTTTTATTTRACASSSFDYLAHVRHLQIEYPAINLDSIWSEDDPPPVAISDYLQGQEFERLCRLDGLSPAFVKYIGAEQDEHYLHQYLQLILYRESIWSVASPILEKLQSLTIPISDLQRYLDVVDRLERLESVCFRFSNSLFEFGRTNYGDVYSEEAQEMVESEEESEDGSEEQRTVLIGRMVEDGSEEQTKVRIGEKLRGMVRFIEAHKQLFKGTLKTATWLFDGDIHWESDIYPQELLLDMYRALPPVQAPRFLSEENLLHVVAHPGSTDLGQVKSFTYFEPDSPWNYSDIAVVPSILRQCRSLKKLSIQPLGAGSFGWAVQEKLQLESTGSRRNGGAAGPAPGQVLLRQEQEHKGGLVPLSKVSLKEVSEDYNSSPIRPLTDEVDDIVFAFGATLTDLAVSLRSAPYRPSVSFGQEWVDLPLLTRLWITGWDTCLNVDRHLLSRCPNLEVVCLANAYDASSMVYRCQNIVPSLPAQLPNLETLNLNGRSALTFHPATLDSTTKLSFLTLTVSRFNEDICFIPPVEELNRSYRLQDGSEPAVADQGQKQAAPTTIRPPWTWDWKLPQLTQLSLTSEFAYRFEFKMLQGCPLLKRLHLCIQTREKQHTRTITHSDLIMQHPGIDTNNNFSPSSAVPERIISPVLETLVMSGRWIMDDSVLSAFITGMFPALRNLTFKGQPEISLGGLIKAIKLSTELASVTVPFPVPSSTQEAVELGLRRVTTEDRDAKHNVILAENRTWVRFTGKYSLCDYLLQ
ncbi:hypothetical protein BGX33_004833 [Mortierella sp. NVP41]|nr:hypothetical protein BGX33_004833 [Mortierella sp. NVP41]